MSAFMVHEIKGHWWKSNFICNDLPRCNNPNVISHREIEAIPKRIVLNCRVGKAVRSWWCLQFMSSWDTAPHMPVRFPGGSKKGKGWGRRPGKWEDPLCCYFCNKPARHAPLTAGCTSTCCHLRARERRRAGAAQRGRQLRQLVAPAEAVLQRLLAASWNEIVFMCLFPALLGLCLFVQLGLSHTWGWKLHLTT